MARITKRENGKWQARIERIGQPDQSKTFQTKDEAKRWSTAIEREMDSGAFIKRDAAERTTFKVAVDRYISDVLPSKRGQVADESRLRRLVETFGKYSLSSISAAMLSAYRDERLKAVSAQSVVHELGLVTRVFKACCMDWGIALPQGIPTLLVRKPTVANGRTRRLEPHEEILLFAALKECKSPWPYAATFLAIETAGRQSELMSLTWKEVDLKRCTARFRGIDGRETKNGDAYRDVPLSSRAIELLQSLPRNETSKVVQLSSKKKLVAKPERVLPITQNALQLSFERALARARKTHVHRLLEASLRSAGLDAEDADAQLRALIYKRKTPLPLTFQLIEDFERDDTTLLDFHFHDLRHEAISRMAEKLQMHELMKVAGQKTSTVTARYYHPRIEALAAKLG